MRMRNLEQYKVGGSGNELQLEIPLPRTPDGRVYRFSPNVDAHPRHFLLGDRLQDFPLPASQTARMTHMPGTPGTVCPYSGTTDEDNAFTHPDDVAAAREVVAHAARSDVADLVHGLFENLGRRNSGSKFLQIKVGPKPTPKPKPRFARRDLLRELVCDECGRDYGVYAISLFCPDCGAPNIHLHFAREVELVRRQVEYAGTLDADQQELAYRLLGNAHEDVLTAFEATLKTVYQHKLAGEPGDSSQRKQVGNTFQNIDRGRKRFAEFNFDPFGNLAPEALAVLTLNIQKRHVIGHNLGIADATFAEHADDARLGETVPLVGDDIIQFAEICQMVVDDVDTWLAQGVAAPNTDLRTVTIKPAEKRSAELKIGELGPLAVRIGLWISSHSTKGFDDHLDQRALEEAFPDASLDELGLAVAELARDGHLNTTSLSSSRIPRMRTTTELYLSFDPHALKQDPAADVVSLIDLALTKTGMVGAEGLFAELDWPLRRFNPAFAYMIAQVDENRVLRGGMGDHPARGFVLGDTDRVDLNRFVARLRR